MTWTLDDSLQAVAPCLSNQLVSEEVFGRIRQIARQLPDVSMVGFECELGTSEPGADFAIAVRAAPGDRDLLARWLASSSRVPQNHAWDRIRTFCAAWSTADSPLYESIPTIWLEWDTVSGNADLSIPNMLVDNPGGDRAYRIAEQSLNLLLDGAVPAPIAKSLKKCISTLPPGSTVFQIGAMLSRDMQGVRLCLAQLDIPETSSYLARIGWPGSVQDLCESLSPLSSLPVYTTLGIDIGARIFPRIGIEFYLDEMRRPTTDPRWRTFLDELVSLGMCTPAKRQALLDWPGRGFPRFPWSASILRGLNHVKLIYQPGKPLSAKVYFGFVQVRS